MAEVEIKEEQTFSGMCDASAGVALTEDLFVVADDESNILRTYSRRAGGSPVAVADLSAFLAGGGDEAECDLEGAARLGDFIYWISSHGRNKQGENRPARHRFFATRLLEGPPPRLEAVGRPYRGLLQDLIATPSLRRFQLEESARRAPNQRDGLNIEGLCARSPDSLWIAFRNPIPDGNSLLIPLLNPEALVREAGTRARFGAAVELDLGGNGVRDMARRNDDYFIVAGSYKSARQFQLFEWDGLAPAGALRHEWDGKRFNPEAILTLPTRTQELLVLSDAGSDKVGGLEGKDLPPARQRFRGVTLRVIE